MGPDPSLTPELIHSQSFTSAFRGLDPGEVRAFLARVAADVKAWRERAEHLESAWRSAEERAARPPVLDEEALIDAVGDETASVLRTARAAATELRSKAATEAEERISASRAEAERLLAEARAEAESLIAKAELDVEQIRSVCAAEVDRTTRESEESASKLIADAQAEAAELLERSLVEAAGIAAKAEQDRIMTIEGANSTRDRILEDLARRRRVASVQIEQLRAGRERLIDSYALVRRTLDEVQSELARADAEARAAADVVGRRLRGEPLAGLDDGGHEDAGLDDGGHEDAGLDDGDNDGGGVVEARQSGAPTSAVDELFARIRANRSELAASHREVQVGGDTVSAAPDAGEPGLGVAPAGDSCRGNPEEIQPEEIQPKETQPKETQPDGAPPEGTLSDEEEYLLQRRESTIGDLEMRLTRSLKRALQDEQNDLLDKLRILTGDLSAETLLGEEQAQVANYGTIVAPLLAEAALKGSAFASECLEVSGVGGVQPNEVPPVDDLADTCARGLATALRRRLEQAIDSVSADGPAVHVEDRENLVEAIGSAYREWKSQRIERLAGDALCGAFSRGTWSSVPGGGALRWIVDDLDGPCPDCDDDALAGELPKPEEFPTGQMHPPAHSGCRCLLVPVAVAASRVG